MTTEIFQRLTREAYRSCELSWAASTNKLRILRPISKECERRINGASNEKQKERWRVRKYRWDELRTRARWASRFMGRNVSKLQFDAHVQGILNNIYMMSGGEELPDFEMTRIRTPISFTVEPCEACKQLEESFTPNDNALRLETQPWTEQFYLIMESLVTDAFKVIGAGEYYREKIREIEPTLIGDTSTGYPWSKVIQLWDVMMQHSRQFLYSGRNCFHQTELNLQKSHQNLRREHERDRKIDLNIKYFTIKDNALKCVTGLYAINRKKLCPTCKANVEGDPIRRG